jgi:hypothetical protein
MPPARPRLSRGDRWFVVSPSEVCVDGLRRRAPSFVDGLRRRAPSFVDGLRSRRISIRDTPRIYNFFRMGCPLIYLLPTVL